MWSCTCGSQNDEDALACINCGKERDLLESEHDEYPSALKEIEEAQMELEGSPHHVREEPVTPPVPTPVSAPRPTPAPASFHTHGETDEMETLHHEMGIEGPKSSVYDEIEDLGKELGEVPLAPPHVTEEGVYDEYAFEEEGEGSTVKKVLRIIDLSIICTIIVFVSIYSVVQIGRVEEARFSAYLSQCLGIWIRSIIATQAVLVIGGIIYFILWEPPTTRAR
ncbi:MAG: hypothetical protein ACYSWY_02860 [Planctomycetota bacterium]|jgi:hypothetical protein